jgi:hypothetical protein
MRIVPMMDKTSYGIAKTAEWKGSAVWYKAICSCGGGDGCDMDIEFEFDKDFGYISLTFNKEVQWNDYTGDSFLSRIWKRICISCKVIFTGYHEFNGTFMIQGEEHIDAIITALQEGKDKLKQFKIDFDKENPKVKDE